MSWVELVRKQMRDYPFVALDNDDRPYCKICLKFFACDRKHISNNIATHNLTKYHRDNCKKKGLADPLLRHRDRFDRLLNLSPAPSEHRERPNRIAAGETRTLARSAPPTNRKRRNSSSSSSASSQSDQTTSDEQIPTDPEQTSSGALDDLNFNDLRSPLLSTVLENLRTNLSDVQAQASGLGYEEIKVIFDEVLESIRTKVGDRNASSLLWNIILRIRTIKTENGGYDIMFKL